MKHRRASGQAPLALAPLLALLLLAPPGCSAYCPTDAYIEALGDLLADKTLLVEECHRQLLGLKQDMDNLPETPAHLPACAVADDAAKVRTELESANAELAAAEELLEVAQMQLEEDEHDIEADGRDLVAVLRQLSATRQALVEAQHEMQRQHTRMASAADVAGSDAACQAVAMDLDECREHAQLLQEQGAAVAAAAAAGEGCSLDRALLAETRLRIAELSQENADLQARLGQEAAQGGVDVEQLQADMSRLRSQNAALEELWSAALADPAAAATQLKEQVLASQERNAQLSKHLVRTAASLEATRQQIRELKREREELKASLAASQAGACGAHDSALAAACKPAPAGGEECRAELAAAGADAESRLAAAAEECQGQRGAAAARHAAAQEEASQLLAAAEARIHACNSRHGEVSEELARTAGTVEGMQQWVAELRREQKEAKASLSASQEEAAACLVRERDVAEAHLVCRQAEQECQRQLRAAGDGADRRLAAAEEQAARALAAAAAAEAAAAAAAAGRSAAEAAAAALEAARLDGEVARATAEAELRVFREQKEAEVARLVRMLDAHQEANRELQRAALLLQEAEAGWLPLWAQRLVRRGVSAAATRGGAVQQRLAGHWAAAQAAVHSRMGPAAARAQHAAATLWAARLRPALARSVHRYVELEAAALRGIATAARRCRAAAAQAAAQAVAAKAAADAAALRQLERLPLRPGLATPQLAGGAVWLALGAAALPVAWALAAALARALLFRLRPARLRVERPGVEALSRLQGALGYSWRKQEALQEALGGDSRGATGRLAWLGSALLQLLAAEEAFRQQPDGAGPQELQEAAEALAAPAALAAKPGAATLGGLVSAGPGARSLQAVADKAAELYAACLGAAFVDGGGSLDAPRRVFVGGAAADGE